MKRLVWILLMVLALVGLFFLWNKNTWNQNTPKPAPPILATESATVLTPSKPLPNFSLQDSNGKPFTQDAFIGHWTLLFFGYADCPKICPTALAIVSGVWRAFPEQSPHPKAQFVFASLDPTSDTPTKLKAFLSRFNPTFIGLTGEASEMSKLTKSSSVYSFTDPEPNIEGQKIIDHSAILLLINPEGRLHALFTPPHQIETIKKDLEALMDR